MFIRVIRVGGYMRRIPGSLALVLLLSAMSVLPGCTVNLNSVNMSVGYNKTVVDNAAIQGMLQNCYTRYPLWINEYTNQTVMGINVVAGDADVLLMGWNGDICSMYLQTTGGTKFHCTYSRDEVNQSGIEVLQIAGARCGYGSESDRLCVGSGPTGSFTDTGGVCS